MLEKTRARVGTTGMHACPIPPPLYIESVLEKRCAILSLMIDRVRVIRRLVQDSTGPNVCKRTPPGVIVPSKLIERNK